MTPLAIGTDVVYHGSLSNYNGMPMTVEHVSEHDPANLYADNHRYTLIYGSRPWEALYNVRRQSFTPVEGDNGQA